LKILEGDRQPGLFEVQSGYLFTDTYETAKGVVTARTLKQLPQYCPAVLDAVVKLSVFLALSLFSQ